MCAHILSTILFVSDARLVCPKSDWNYHSLEVKVTNFEAKVIDGRLGRIEKYDPPFFFPN